MVGWRPGGRPTDRRPMLAETWSGSLSYAQSHRCVNRGNKHCVVCGIPMDNVPEDATEIDVLAVGDVIYVPYIVKPNDTIQSIASMFAISPQHLTQCMISTGKDTYLDR